MPPVVDSGRGEGLVEPLRLAIIGLGVMGRDHLKNALAQSDLIRVVGVADVAPRARAAAEAAQVQFYDNLDDCLDAGPEAVIVATPHPLHEEAVVAAAKRGINVLCEKQIAASVAAADRMVAACRQHGVVLAMDFQQRLSPSTRAMRRLLDDGTIGELARVSLVATSWYRTQAYYDSGSWRGTWQGEGGGVLMNQAPHNLDMYCWLAGQPQRIKSTVHTRVHRIETENTVAALLEHEAGRVDTFVTSTAEFPGKTEWTFVGERGTMVCDGKSVRLFRLDEPLSAHILNDVHGTRPKGEWEEVPLDPVAPRETGHTGLLRQFVSAVREGAAPIATGEDGVVALDLANAIILSSYRDQPVDVPVDRVAYDQLLHQLRQREV